MNKFIVALTIALASVALANAGVIRNGLDDEVSELSLNPTDDMETDKLQGTNLVAFRDFCIRTRDHVVGDMKNRANIFASDIFSNFFRTIGEIGQSGLDANQRATEKLAHQLVNPNAPIDESSQEEVDRIVAEGQRAIKEAGSQPQGLINAFLTGVKSFAAAGYGQTVAKIQEFQNKIKDQIQVSKTLIVFCERLSSYEEQAINIFEETKSHLVQEDAEQYKNVKYSEVAPKCMTANRLSRAEGFCKFVLTAKEPLAKILGLELNNKDLSEQ